MPDQSLEILLKIESDLAALKKTVAGLDEVKTAAVKSGGAHQEAAKHVAKHESGHRELHKAMHLVSQQSPILGLALKMIFSPMGGLIMGVVLAVELFKKALEDAKKKAEEFDKIGAEVWKANQEGAREAAKTTDDYTKKLKDAADGIDKISDKYERQKTLLIELQKQHKALMESMGLKSDDLAAEQQLHQLKINELSEEQKRHPEDKAAEARRNLQTAQSAVSSVELAKRENELNPLDKSMGELRQASHLRDFALKFGAAGRPDALAHEYDMTVAEDKIKKFKDNEKLIADYNNELSKLKEASAKATEAELKHTEKVRKLTEEVETGGKVLGIHKTSAFQQTKLPEVQDALSFAEDAAHKFSGGGKLSSEEEQVMRMVAQVIAKQSVSTKIAAQMFMKASANQDIQASFTEKLLIAMEAMADRLAPFEKRLKNLEGKIRPNGY